MRIRYTSWTGKTPVRLTPDYVFDRLCRHLSTTDDVDEALDRLASEGLEGTEFALVGVDELLATIRDRVRDLSRAHNLDHVFDEHGERLDRILARERGSVDRLADASRRERKQERLSRLPPGVREKIDRLVHYDFTDVGAAGDFDRLLREREAIDRVADFVDQHRRRFRGPNDLSFEEALAILGEIETLRGFEEALFRRDFSALDLDQVDELLGGRASGAVRGMRSLIASLTSAGFVARKGAKLVLAPRGARTLGEIALQEIHSDVRFDASGAHAVDRSGHSDADPSGTRPYRFGDAAEIAAVASVANALRRGGCGRLQLMPEDLCVFERTRSTRSATVLLLDMSWSMSWDGRFAAAKKVALAMQVLMRTRYPQDYFAVVGFYTRAVKLEVADLPEASWNVGEPFTNLQDGLRLGGELLERARGKNRNLIVVTDGQPTAYFVGARLYCEWPMSIGGLSTRATVETLREVERVTRKGIRINTFMLDDSPPLRAFVDKMTAINRGRAFYTTPSELGRFVLIDHVARRRKLI